jgi:hypothetical protein
MQLRGFWPVIDLTGLSENVQGAGFLSPEAEPWIKPAPFSPSSSITCLVTASVTSRLGMAETTGYATSPRGTTS